MGANASTQTALYHAQEARNHAEFIAGGSKRRDAMAFGYSPKAAGDAVRAELDAVIAALATPKEARRVGRR